MRRAQNAQSSRACCTVYLQPVRAFVVMQASMLQRSRVNTPGAALALAIALAHGVAALGAEDAAETQPEDAGRAPERLDLRTPDINDILTPEQIAEALGTDDRSIEEVEVEGERSAPPPATPDVWPAIAAPVWALLNPGQSWRIFLPIPPDRAKEYADAPPRATESMREPATGIPKMAGEW
jgi:hypothetical protein